MELQTKIKYPLGKLHRTYLHHVLSEFCLNGVLMTGIRSLKVVGCKVEVPDSDRATRTK